VVSFADNYMDMGMETTNSHYLYDSTQKHARHK